MVMNPRSRDQGQSIPGNYGFNLNPISRQNPTGKFVAESMNGQGFNQMQTDQGLMDQLSVNPRNIEFNNVGKFGNELFSGLDKGKNTNTGISNLNRTRFKRG